MNNKWGNEDYENKLIDISEKAWKLYNKAEKIAWDLWCAFEPYFLKKCSVMDDEEYQKSIQNFTK